MSIVPSITLHLTHKCDITLCIGFSGSGEPEFSTAPDIDVPCRYSATHKIVRGFSSSDDVVAARALFFIGGDFPVDIRVRSLVTYAGEVYEVIQAHKFSTEVNEEIHHWELLCR